MGQRKAKRHRTEKTSKPQPEAALPTSSADSSPAWKRDALCGGLLALAVILLYGHTLQVPWYFDDFPNILENPLVRDLERALGALYTNRWPATVTFAVNYALHDYQVAGYHVVNILIHLTSGLLVYLLLKRVFRPGGWLPLVGALIFLAHPLQTQAVTYIVQRQTSLAALLGLLAVYLYALAREVSAGAGKPVAGPGWLFYGLALVSGALAVLTKQNTATLPLLLLLFDRFFLAPRLKTGSSWKAQILLLLPFCLAPAVLGWRMLAPVTTGELPVHTLLRAEEGFKITPLQYLVTEFSVIWLYVRLLFLPYSQALEYNYPVVERLLTLQSVAALAGILALLGLAWYGRRRWPLVSFGILWFFTALLVESTFIPLDPVFEHRLYLPMLGFAVLVTGLLSRLPDRRQALVAAACLVLVLGGLTFLRNALWADRLAFYEDNVAKQTPNKRTYLTLSKLYLERGRIEEAEKVLHALVERHPSYTEAYVNLSNIYLNRGDLRQAEAVIGRALENASSQATKELLVNLGVLYQQTGRLQEALEVFTQALQVDPNYHMAHSNLGIVHDLQGDYLSGERHHRAALRSNPEYGKGYVDLGINLYKQGRYPESLAALREGVTRNPENVDAWYYFAGISARKGDPWEARRAVEILRGLDPERAAKIPVPRSEE